jgi:very-short-patch-repair endonuclease
MDPSIRQQRHRAVWSLVRRQHWVVTRAQLITLGFSVYEIQHRIHVGRLHPVHRGVYAVGRPELTHRARWMAAVLAVGASFLSHLDAAGLLGVIAHPPGRIIELSVVGCSPRERRGLLVHRRSDGVLAPPGTVDGIPVTDPADTVIDIAPRLDPLGLERAINEADKLDLVTPARLRERATAGPRRLGAATVRDLIDRVTFRLTDTELEQRFLPLTREAGLPAPLTQHWLNGNRVDFYFPALGLVVETDGGRFHRTPFQQTRDRRRDQAHTAAGITQLRFTHGQIRFEPDEVVRILRATADRLPRASV